MWVPRAAAPLRPPASKKKGFPRRKQGKTTVDFNTPGQTIISYNRGGYIKREVGCD